MINAEDIQKRLQALYDPERVQVLQRFFKTGPGEYGYGDIFIGLRVPEVRRLAKEYGSLPISETIHLLRSPIHEARLLALLILIRIYSCGDVLTQKQVYHAYLQNTRCINNWDLVDVSAEHIVGAHLKNTVAISVANQVITSQHIGDLETAQAMEAFERVIDDFSKIYEFSPQTVACDLHPDYLSTKYAQKTGLRIVPVQHHYAHVLSVMAENELDGPVLGVSWDGTGFGNDGTIWGGEFLTITADSFERVGHLRTFRLPGGEKAIVEPRRSALGLLYEIFGDEAFSMLELAPIKAFPGDELKILRQMFLGSVNSPVTSSAGRLFDATSSIVGIQQTMRYEGQAAMALEFASDGVNTDSSYSFEIINSKTGYIVDWEQMVRGIIIDISGKVNWGLISAKFHNTLAEMILEMAKRVGEERVVLSGGCFQNKYFTERTIAQLKGAGFRPYWHQRIPPNDGGIALGQIMAAMREMPKE